VIVGRVYNEPNRPPYESVAGIPHEARSGAAPPCAEGDGYNEIRFEDAATLEEIFLHAQRDFNEVVRASHSTGVGGDQSNSVTGNDALGEGDGGGHGPGRSDDALRVERGAHGGRAAAHHDRRG